MEMDFSTFCKRFFKELMGGPDQLGCLYFLGVAIPAIVAITLSLYVMIGQVLWLAMPGLFVDIVCYIMAHYFSQKLFAYDFKGEDL